MCDQNEYELGGILVRYAFSCRCVQSVGVYPGEENKGVVLQYKKKGMSRKPSEMYARVVLNSKNPRKVYRTIRKILGTQNYRRDLIGVSDGPLELSARDLQILLSLYPHPQLAVRKASVILHQQRPKKRISVATSAPGKK